MNIGFALTRHCNLRCAHCIRDDVTDVRSLDPDLLASILDQAMDLFPRLEVSFTGGEPLIHPSLFRVVREVGRRDLPYRLVTNGWHVTRTLPVLESYRPERVHLSLSGATRAVHDAERGRGSWNRLLEALAALTSREIPVVLSLVVDRRTRQQLRQAADLAEELGVPSLQYILPTPVPESVARDSDLAPHEWLPVRREVAALDGEEARDVDLHMSYGGPFEGEEEACRTFRLDRLYIDAEGRVASCCQLSEYGRNEAEVVADLNRVSLAVAYQRYADRLREQWMATRPPAESDDLFTQFPCLRCARANGKLTWLKEFPRSPWSGAAEMEGIGELGCVASEGSRDLPVTAANQGAH